MTLFLFLIVSLLGVLYIGYNMGKKSVSQSTITPPSLSFSPPISLKNPAIISAHMQYALTVILGDLTTKNGHKYVTLLAMNHSLIGSFPIIDSVLIADGQTKKTQLDISDIKKGREAQVNITYDAYQSGEQEANITYILLK